MNDIIRTNIETVKRFLAGTHAPDIEEVRIIDETTTEDVTCHGFPGPCPTDRESYKAWFRFFRTPFTGMEFEVTRMVADETHVAVQWVVHVTHSGPFAGVPATGRRIAFDGVAIYRMQADRIAETWLHPNEAAILAQIGALEAA